VLLNAILGCLAALSLGLLLWQWLVARRFPLHRRLEHTLLSPAVTLLKPLKGCDETTEDCLRSWFEQQYSGPVQILFAVASAEDPVCGIVRRLIDQFPALDAELKVCSPLTGANLKVSKLAHLEKEARHEVIIVSDADVKVPRDFLANAVAPLAEKEVGLVNCFYALANPSTMAMQWEAVAINADFWSQVLQSESLKPLDFALGAVMATRRELVNRIGGFAALADCLADDYQLGHRIARLGQRIKLCPVVVECWSPPMTFKQVWKHQLRWARTIRVCQPLPYFFSILSNASLWPLLWLALSPGWISAAIAAACCVARMVTARDLQLRLRPRQRPSPFGFAALKDLFQTGVWLWAFLGNRIEWRGERMRLKRDGTLLRR
jgi:ceramide glucosyltransferase